MNPSNIIKKEHYSGNTMKVSKNIDKGLIKIVKKILFYI